MYVLSNTLKLLHPFMPFITEEIWLTLPHDGESIMISKWPEFSDCLAFAGEEAEMESIMEAVRAVRNRRAEMNVPPSRKAKYFIATAAKSTFEAAGVFMDKLKLAAIVTHVADARTCVLHPASHTHRQMSDEQLVEAGVAPDLIRFSVGIEHVDDIIADLEQALESI